MNENDNRTDDDLSREARQLYRMLRNEPASPEAKSWAQALSPIRDYVPDRDYHHAVVLLTAFGY